MGRIRVLDDHIANQIAAGEVVERPSSVVKELAENAIDAGATRIDAVIEEGGLSLIRLTDNGTGMDEEDLLLSFSRHATSKIAIGKDLFQIRTLGFRGEALPSIAAVSRLICTSSPNESGLGYRLTIEGGALKPVEPVAAPRGTDIQVKELFFNTPARLKYMKTVQTETSHIADYMYRLAMAHPHIAFSLRHNGNSLLQTSGRGDLLQVIGSVYGNAAAKLMLPVSAESPDYSLEGYVSKPELDRSNRQGITFIVNGRFVRSIGLAQAAQQAYHTLLPIHRYPLVALHLRMEPSLVDVNVHPAKLEVRFSKEQELQRFIEMSLKSALERQTFIPELASRHTQKIREYVAEPEPVQQRMEWDARTVRESRSLPYNSRTTENKTSVQAIDLFQPPQTAAPPSPVFPELHPIGQLHGTYIVAQNDNALYLLDQHAAHERINYERYYELFGEPERLSQDLIVPITLEFTSADAAIIRERLPIFEQAGVKLEHWGGQSFIVRSYPYWFPKGEESRVINEMVDWIIAEKQTIDVGKMREKTAIMCACKSSIRANESLTTVEMEALIKRLSACKNPFSCPHGRPIVISFTTYELEKMFKRVM